MNKNIGAFVLVVALTWQMDALAFRNCEQLLDESAYRGNSGYSVSEIEFDPWTRVATGTETHYNYANADTGAIYECHVTYELQGVYDESSALFLLHANRTNQSHSCDAEFVEVRFPTYRNYTVQVDVLSNGRAAVLHADNGEAFASADWQSRHMSYSTEEACEQM